MSKLVHIPEETLQQLLRESGRSESVEIFLRDTAVQEKLEAGHRLLKRARAAYWSRFWLLFSAIVSWISLVFGPDVEGVISSLLLTGMTVVEYRVYAFFQATDIRGSIWGWWNQCLFAFLFLVYGVYHGTFDTLSPQINAMVDPDLLPTVIGLQRFFYYTVALVGAGGQFYLACYYRSALK